MCALFVFEDAAAAVVGEMLVLLELYFLDLEISMHFPLLIITECSLPINQLQLIFF